MSGEVSRRTREDEWDQIRARIAALEATVARLTAEVTGEDAREFRMVEIANMERGGDPLKTALTAFLERRMKG